MDNLIIRNFKKKTPEKLRNSSNKLNFLRFFNFFKKLNVLANPRGLLASLSCMFLRRLSICRNTIRRSYTFHCNFAQSLLFASSGQPDSCPDQEEADEPDDLGPAPDHSNGILGTGATNGGLTVHYTRRCPAPSRQPEPTVKERIW